MLVELEGHLRVAAAEFRDEEGEPVAAPGGSDTKVEYRLLGAQGPQLAEEVVFRHLDLFHPLDIQGACPGDLDGGHGAVKELDAQLALQLVDVVGKGRLGNKGLFGGAGQVALLRQGQYIVKLIQAHKGGPPIRFFLFYALFQRLSIPDLSWDGKAFAMEPYQITMGKGLVKEKTGAI